MLCAPSYHRSPISRTMRSINVRASSWSISSISNEISEKYFQISHCKGMRWRSCSIGSSRKGEDMPSLPNKPRPLLPILMCDEMIQNSRLHWKNYDNMDSWSDMDPDFFDPLITSFQNKFWRYSEDLFSIFRMRQVGLGTRRMFPIFSDISIYLQIDPS